MSKIYYMKIIHSAKGTTWEDHKYVKRIDGTYYYPKGYESGRTIDTLKKQEEDEAPDYTDEDLDTLAMEVIKGNFDNGEERKKLLGDNYQAVQDLVNKILKSGGGASSEEKSNEDSELFNEKKSAVESVNEKLKEREASRTGSKESPKPDMDKIYGVYNKRKEQEKKKNNTGSVRHSAMDNSSHLAHHGILGMKWGIRRYQPYPNGSKGGKEIGQAAKVKRDRISNRFAKKMMKTEKKISSLDAKAKTQYQKALNASSGLFSSQKRTNKWVNRSIETTRKSDIIAARGSNYYNHMQKKFDKMGIDMNPDLKSLGEEYIRRMEDNTRALYEANIYGHLNNRK